MSPSIYIQTHDSIYSFTLISIYREYNGGVMLQDLQVEDFEWKNKIAILDITELRGAEHVRKLVGY